MIANVTAEDLETLVLVDARELERLRSELASLLEIELSEECRGLLVAHGSDGAVIVAGEFSSGQEFREKYRLSAQGGEVPEPTDDDLEAIVFDVGGDPSNDFEHALVHNGWAWLARRFRPAPPHPDTVVVSRKEWERLRKFERDTREATNRTCSDCASYNQSQSCPGCRHPENPQNDYAFDWCMAQRCEFYSLRAQPQPSDGEG